MSLHKNWTFGSVAGTALVLVAGLLVQTPATAAPVFTITSPNSQNIMAGEALKFTGTVAGGKVGKSVHAQMLVKKKWTSFGSGKVRIGSIFAFSKKVTVAGNFKLRLVYSANKGQPTYSKTLSAHVRRWYYLSQRYPVEGYEPDGGPSTVNGQTYVNSALFWGYRDDWNSQWDLQRKCTVLQATVGLQDDSESSSAVSLQMFVDQSEGPIYNLTLGHSYKVSFDIRGGLRLGVVGSEIGGYHYKGGAVLGNARIACLPLN